LTDNCSIPQVNRAIRKIHSPANCLSPLTPLLDIFGEYDRVRQSLIQSGGSLGDIERVTFLLRKKVSISINGSEHVVSMNDPAGLQEMLGAFKNNVLYLDRRIADYGFPAYYLCRLYRDPRDALTVVVEDLYKSTGYDIADGRFARFFRLGREVSFLRLSRYRPATSRMLAAGNECGSRVVDDLLYELARGVLNSMWQEDQRLAMLTAHYFGLPRFRQAVELLYLILASDLCELRAGRKKTWLLFFQRVYVQPAIESLLDLLPDMYGTDLGNLRKRALDQYLILCRAFRSFLVAPVQRGSYQGEVPLYKLVFGNLTRLDRISRELSAGKSIESESERLEGLSAEAIHSILLRRPDFSGGISGFPLSAEG
jgi:hypothetical protein